MIIFMILHWMTDVTTTRRTATAVPFTGRQLPGDNSDSRTQDTNIFGVPANKPGEAVPSSEETTLRTPTGVRESRSG